MNTPGEMCYMAFWQVQRTDGHLHYPPPFHQLPEVTRRAWEAAAQAVAQHAVADLYIEFSESADTLDVQRILAAAVRHVPPPEEEHHG